MCKVVSFPYGQALTALSTQWVAFSSSQEERGGGEDLLCLS